MKKHLCILILLIFSTVICYANSGRGRVKIAHGTIVTDKGTLLRGCSIDAGDNGIDREKINSVKEYGLNSFHLYVSNTSDVGTNYAAYIDSIVNWTEENSLYLIITPSSGATWTYLFGYVDSTNYNCTMDFWKFYAPRYKDKTHVIYELVNEPVQYIHSSDTIPKFESEAYKLIRSLAPETHICLPMIWSTDWDPWHMKAWANIESDIKRLTDRGVDMSNVSVSFHTYGFSGIALDSILLCFRALGHSYIDTELPCFFDNPLLGAGAYLNFKDVRIHEKDSVSYTLLFHLDALSQHERYQDVLEDYGISWVPDFGTWPYTVKSDTRTWKAGQRIEAEWFDIGGDSSVNGIYSQLCYVGFNSLQNNFPWIMFKKVDFNQGLSQFCEGFSYCNIRIACNDFYANNDNIELHLDSLTGKKIGELKNFNTGGWDIWQTFSFNIEKTEGVHAIYFVVHGSVNIDLFYFSQGSETERILQIPKCITPPVIDGVLDDIWNYTFPVPLLYFQEGVGTGTLKSPTDHFSTLRTMWDDNNFYAFVHVMDDTICTGGANPWENDAIELYFDGGNEKKPNYYDANDKFWIWIYGIQDTDLLYVNSWWWGPGKWAWKKTSTGYDFELRIPKESLTFPLVAGHAIGFEIVNNDRDNNIQGRTNATQWWSTSNNASKYPSVWGTALLKDGKLSYNPPPAPVLIASANGAIVKSTTLILNWQPSARASSYQLQIATSPDCGSGLIINDSTIIDPVKEVGSLSPNVAHYWRVRAANASGKSDWSEIRNFITRGIPSISFGNTPLNIGSVPIGKSKGTSFVINNIGTDTLKISNITVTNPVWSLSQTVFSILPNKSVVDTAIFTPNSFGAATGKLIILSNSSSSPDTITVAGNSPIPMLSTLKSSLVYGNTAKNITKKDTLKITNSSINTLIVDSIYTKASAFTADRISGTVGTDTMRLVVSFTPTTFATYSDTVYLRNNSATPLVKIPLSGNSPAPVIGVLKTSIAFSNVAKNITKKDTVKITNSSINTLTVDSIYAKTIAFTVDHISGTVGTDTMKLVVSFTPTAFATYSDTVYLRNNSATPLVKIPLSGNSPAPVIGVSKTSIAFSDVAKNTTKRDTVRAVNSSINTLTIDSIYTKTSAFTVDKISGSVGSDTLKVVVSFVPTAFTSYTDTVYLRNNSATPLVKIPLSGSSPQPTILCNPRSIAFGDVGIYDSTKTILKVANSSVNILTIDSIYTHSTIFTSLSSSSQVTNKDTASITIQFKPVKFGAFSDTLFLRNNSDTALFKIPLSGNTPTSSIFITPSSIAFGTVHKDTTHQLLFTITNSSISVLQIDSFWTRTKYFNVTHMLAIGQIRKGDSTKVTIRFTPDSSRSYIDTMFIANNSPVSPFKVPLSGNGTTTGIKGVAVAIPTEYSLSQNFPNPYNPSTTIQYGLPARSTVRLIIYNLLGQVVKELVNTEQNAGYQSVIWNANESSGLYFYRLEATSKDDPSKHFVETKKMLLLR